jgi:hypothetical protein
MDDQTKQSFSWIQRLLRNKSSYLHVDDIQDELDRIAATITRLEGEVAEEHKLMRYFMSGSHRYAHQRDRFRAVARDLHARLAGYNHEMELAHAEDLAYSEEKLNVERAQREQAERERDRLLDRVANAIFCPPTMRQCQKACAEGSADARDCWLAWARGDE